MEFQVDLDIFRGPMDLLLYLVRRHEVEVTDVPIADIAQSFVEHLEVLEHLAIEQVGEFVELASVLLEIKAKALVPRPEENETPIEEVREDLVKRLLEYKQYRDAAVLLEERARQWEERFGRIAPEAAGAGSKPPDAVIGEVHVWDLVGAMTRVLRKRERAKPRQIIHDDTPIETHMKNVESLVREKGRVVFSDLFDDDMPRTRVVGMFLAVLELVKRGTLQAKQAEIFDGIWPSFATAPRSPTEEESLTKNL
ncbi:MAG: chromosome segregation protein ScpA [Planctomycetota bacterium]|nr:MAG: chromosome segregation protein ScpA [Planctomycetota bacterium]